MCVYSDDPGVGIQTLDDFKDVQERIGKHEKVSKIENSSRSQA